eukprot:598331-Amphidinium_carterae.1
MGKLQLQCAFPRQAPRGDQRNKKESRLPKASLYLNDLCSKSGSRKLRTGAPFASTFRLGPGLLTETTAYEQGTRKLIDFRKS